MGEGGPSEGSTVHIPQVSQVVAGDAEATLWGDQNNGCPQSLSASCNRSAHLPQPRNGRCSFPYHVIIIYMLTSVLSIPALGCRPRSLGPVSLLVAMGSEQCKENPPVPGERPNTDLLDQEVRAL